MEKNTKFENQLITGTLFGFFVSGICSIAMGSLIPFFRESYHLSYDVSGMLLSLQSVGNMVAILLMGFLPAFLGRRKSVILTVGWMVAAYLVFATGLGGAVLLPAACLLMGFSRGGCSNFSNTMMSTLPDKKAAVGYNLLHGAYAVGALLAPIVFILFTRQNREGWRGAAYLLLALAVVQLLVYFRMPLPRETVRKKSGGVDRGFFKEKNFWLASVILFCYISSEYAITGWLVTYFQDVGILSADLSQMMSSLLWLVMFIGRVIGALVIGRLSCKLLLAVDGIGLLAFFLIVFFSRTAGSVVFGIVGVGLFMATIYPSAMALATDAIKGNDLGVSLMALTGSVGGILTPAAVGFVAEQAGIQAGMGVVVLMTVLLFGVIMVTLFWKDKKAQ